MGYFLHSLLVFIIFQGCVHGAQLPNKEDQDLVAWPADTPQSFKPLDDSDSQSDSETSSLSNDSENTITSGE